MTQVPQPQWQHIAGPNWRAVADKLATACEAMLRRRADHGAAAAVEHYETTVQARIALADYDRAKRSDR